MQLNVISLALCTAALLSGCATPTLLTGSVSTVFYSEPEGAKQFALLLPDSLSLRDKQIGDLVEQKLIERAYAKAATRENANIAVLIRYSIGQGTVKVTSSPDFVWGGQKVESTTRYPRFFQLIVVDLQKSKLPEHLEIIWQGEVYSEGSTSDMMRLAEHFINTLFDNYGKTVKDGRFRKVVML